MRLGIHVLLLAVAATGAILVWTKDKRPTVGVGDVTVWNLRASEVERVVFEVKGKKLLLEAQTDALGRFYLCTADSAASGGAHAEPPQAKTVTFVSVSPAEKLVEFLAPLKALREIGKISDDRAAEFGLKEPEGTLAIVVGSSQQSRGERKLELGTTVPGGGSRYVRDLASGSVYALKVDVVRELEGGESSLGEHELHAFKEPDIRSVRLVANGGKKRELLRTGPDSKRIWADAATPNTSDETASNWIAMIDRLRPTEWLSTPPTGLVPVVRLEYQVKGGDGGFVEIAKIGGGPKPDFLVRSERTRLWAKTLGAVGEQIEQDLATVLPR